MNSIKLKAYAKINLGLDVIRKRVDGYHDVRMIMQTINLYDRIEVSKISRPSIKIKTNLPYLPVNSDNLVYKSAKLLIDEFNINKGVFIDLKKYIPVSAGMAGGSADCASVLFGMNRLFNLGLTKKDLMERAVKLGADVPYCLLRGTALSEGIGEILTPLKPMPNCYVLIVKPNISVSTKEVYEKLTTDLLNHRPDIDGMITAINKKNLNSVSERLCNVLEIVTIKDYPIIEQIKDMMKNLGALNAIMSGSGPTVFGLFNDYAIAKKAYYEFKVNGISKQVFLTDIFNRKGDL